MPGWAWSSRVDMVLYSDGGLVAVQDGSSVDAWPHWLQYSAGDRSDCETLGQGKH